MTENGRFEISRKPLKTRLFYSVFAAFCIAVLLGVLYLSHQVVRVFETNVAGSASFDRQLASMIELTEFVADIQSAAMVAASQKAFDHERGTVKSASHLFLVELDRLKTELEQNLPEKMWKRAAGIIAGLKKSMPLVEKSAGDVIAAAEAQDLVASQRSISGLMTRLDTVRWGMRDISKLMALVRTVDTGRGLVEAGRMRRTEYWMAALSAAIILGLGALGYASGRSARRSFLELEHANLRLENAHAKSSAYAEEVRQVNDNITALNLQLTENMKKLKEAQDQLIRKGRLSQLGQLTATVAHELRNPLSTVRTSVFLLDRKLKGKGLGIENQISRINNGIVRCDDIITQLLDYASSGSFNCEARDFDAWLLGVVEAETQDLPRMVAVECHMGLDGLNVEFDPGRMSRAIVNLMANASEAMVGKSDDPSKFTTIVPKITISTARSIRGIEFSVSDNGPGISPENMAKILEPLFTTKNFGTGLGLPAVEKILEQHGGGLSVSSQPGQGACFTAWFPARQAKQDAA